VKSAILTNEAFARPAITQYRFTRISILTDAAELIASPQVNAVGVFPEKKPNVPFPAIRLVAVQNGDTS
jgi:hypothetical protein